MNNQALTVYLKAEQRFDNGKATKADEVILALWDENKELAKKNREMAQKISMLEMKSHEAVQDLPPEYAALLGRMCLPTRVTE